MDELEQVLNPYMEKARTDALKVVGASLGVGLLAGGALWVWGSLSSSGAQVIPCVMWGGMVALLIWMLAGEPDPIKAPAPDELLQQIAALNFVGSGADELRDQLRHRGYLTMGEVASAFGKERIARQNHLSLQQPGAKALLGN